ncbi:MAG TPA: hypothetical protein VD908_08370 [Cytophagales bacterium]|nr:hypothetical protein [Cytophagales bacterium]
MIRFFAITFLVILSICFTSSAQADYKTGIGLRAGWPTALSVKQFIGGGSWALEGLVTGRHRGIGAALLLEKHKIAFSTERFIWFYGGGLHGAFYSGQYYRGRHRDLYKKDGFSYGIDGILGLEYFISDIPFTIGIDIKPAVEINYGPYFDLGSAITVRYVF